VVYLKGDIGPFEPSVPTKVPLWLAVHFRQRQKCRIECPEWINVGNKFLHCFNLSIDFTSINLI
jgi:hypothetical protein